MSESAIPWPHLLGDLGRVTTQLSLLVPHIYPLSAPHLGADEATLDATELRLGHALDPQHRELLRFGNGWPGAFLDGDVLGTEDLGQGPRWDQANAGLDLLYEYADTNVLPARNRLYPIFVAPHQPDIFAVRLDGPVTDGGHEVLWFANELIDRWANAHEWWLGAIRIAQQTLESVRSHPGL